MFFFTRTTLKNIGQKLYDFEPSRDRLVTSEPSIVQESEEIPPDYTRLFRANLFAIDTGLLPRVISSYK